MTDIKLQRVYTNPSGSYDDGWRIYVDRLWPRGESKAKFHYDYWVKDIAPSAELREWFHADPQNRWPDFARKYMSELQTNPAIEDLTTQIRRHQHVTLLYSSHDTEHNNATVLAEYLHKKIE
ncbi:DUF488 domain-containing protein [Muribaculum intestinale]|uniref:DUF488 domain-containing protein n=1 Tax=Muribaculum intestinale TaxID=1796646 RepID=UPI000F471B2F|nr:DUF488 family protein [Muribaculum intestinale]ROT09515.1 DUF488 family protein [Muribaculaceae bacterium Isolate-100 (HZI)]RXE65329.1 DUF488 family protein [Muribaculaceae bacterium Isolate-007 (NCI)]